MKISGYEGYLLYIKYKKMLWITVYISVDMLRELVTLIAISATYKNIQVLV